MRWFMITMLISFTTTVAPAAELTLQEAVASALADNPEIRAASERSAAAAERLNGGKRHRLPKIGLSETYLYTNIPAEVFALSLNQGRFDMEEFFLSDPNNPDPLSTWITRVDLVLPVYTGGKLSARIGQAESMASAGELTLSHTREKITFETITAYVNLAKAREHQALLEKAQASTAEHVRIAEQYAAQGFILEADVLQARIYLSEMDDLVTRAANGANLAQAALNFQMGVDQTLPRELTPLPPATPVVGNLRSWISASLEDRQDPGNCSARSLRSLRQHDFRRQRPLGLGDGGRQDRSLGRRVGYRCPRRGSS